MAQAVEKHCKLIRCHIWLAVIVVFVTTNVWGLKPPKQYAKPISPALRKWRQQQQVLHRQKLQQKSRNLGHAQPPHVTTAKFKLIPVNSEIKILQRIHEDNRNKLANKQFAKPRRAPLRKKAAVSQNKTPYGRQKGHVAVRVSKPAYHSSKIRLGKPQVRTELNKPAANGKNRPEAPSIAKYTETVYPANAYEQVEHYIDSVIKDEHQSHQTGNEYYNSNNNQAGSSARAAVSSPSSSPHPASVPSPATTPAQTPAPAPAPPPAPMVAPAPVPAPAPVVEPAPGMAAVAPPASPPVVVTAAPVYPESAPVYPASPGVQTAPVTAQAAVQAPAPVAQYTSPQPVEAKAMARAAAPIPEPKFEEGQVVEMPGLHGKATKYYVQSYPSELISDGKGGYIQTPDPNMQEAVPATKAVPLGPASTATDKSKTDTATVHKVKAGECTVANVNQTDEEKQASKRVYSLSGHVFADLGCFSDCWKRAIPTLEGNHDLLMDVDYKKRGDALQKCAEAALDRGFKYFALQNGGQCFAGKNAESRFNIYGHSQRCGDDGLGGTYANEVYMFEETPTPKHIPSDYAPTAPSKDQAGKCRHGNCDDSDNESYDTSLMKEEQALSDEEDEEASSNDSKNHKNNKLKAIGAAIKNLLKNQDDKKLHDEAATAVVAAHHKIKAEHPTSAVVAAATPTALEASTTGHPKQSAISVLADALMKEGKHKSAMKNSTGKGSSGAKAVKNDTADLDNASGGGDDESKKKKNLPLGAAIARGEKPPCICPDKVCSSKLDLGFAIDASAGAEPGGKEKMGEIMEFARRVASAFKIAPAESHLGLITFSTDAQVMLNFKRFSDPESFVEAKDSVRVKPHNGKFTGQALKLAKDGLFGALHRPDALDVLVVMTDGPSTDNVMAPARSLRDMGVKIISVGIGDHINKRQMANMASDPDEANMFITEFDNLQPLIPKVQKAACVGGILKEPTTPCRCDEKSPAPDPEAEVETAAFLSLLSPTIETETENPERHTEIPTASPADKYKLNNYILKRGRETAARESGDLVIGPQTTSFMDRSGRISSRALPFNNPHPLDFDASPTVQFGNHKSQPTAEVTSKYQHSYENGNSVDTKNEQRNSGAGKTNGPITPNIELMQTDEPEYTGASGEQQGKPESSYNADGAKNSSPSNALYNENDHGNDKSKNAVNPKQSNEEKFNQQQDSSSRPSVGNNGDSQTFRGKQEDGVREGQGKDNKDQDRGTTNYNNDNKYNNYNNGQNKGGENAQGEQLTQNSNQKYNGDNNGGNKKPENGAAGEIANNEGKILQKQAKQQQQMNTQANSSNENTESLNTNSKEKELDANNKGFNNEQQTTPHSTHPDQDDANYVQQGNNGNNVNEGKQVNQSSSLQIAEKDKNSNEEKPERQEQKPDLSKEDLNTQGSQGNNFNSDNQNANQHQQGASETEPSLQFGNTQSPQSDGGKQGQNQADSNSTSFDNNSAKETNGKQSNGQQSNESDKLKSHTKEEGLPFKNDFSHDVGFSIPQDGNTQIDNGNINQNGDEQITLHGSDDAAKDNGNNYAAAQYTKADPMTNAERYNQYVYKEESRLGNGNRNGDNRDAMVKQDAKDGPTYEGTLYKEKDEKSTDKNGNVVEKQRYKGTLVLSEKDKKNEGGQQNEKTTGQQGSQSKSGETSQQLEQGTQQVTSNSKESQKMETPDNQQGQALRASDDNRKDDGKTSAQNQKNEYGQSQEGKYNENKANNDQKDDKQNNNIQRYKAEGKPSQENNDQQNKDTNQMKNNDKENAQAAKPASDENRQSNGNYQQDSKLVAGGNAKQPDDNNSGNNEGKQATQLKNIPDSSQGKENNGDSQQNRPSNENGKEGFANVEKVTKDGKGNEQSQNVQKEGKADNDNERNGNYQNTGERNADQNQNRLNTGENNAQQENSDFHGPGGQLGGGNKGGPHGGAHEGKDDEKNAEFNHGDGNSQQDGGDSSYHGHGGHGGDHGGGGHHGDHDEGAHGEKHGHGHNGEHHAYSSEKPPSYKEEDESDQRVDPGGIKGENGKFSSDKTVGYDQNGKDGAEQQGQDGGEKSDGGRKPGFHFDSSEIQGHQKYENKPETKESARIQRTDKQNGNNDINNKKVVTENNDKEGQPQEQQGKQGFDQNERQRGQGGKAGNKQESSFKVGPNESDGQKNENRLLENDGQENNNADSDKKNGNQKLENQDGNKNENKEDGNSGKYSNSKGQLEGKQDETGSKNTNEEDKGRFNKNGEQNNALKKPEKYKSNNNNEHTQSFSGGEENNNNQAKEGAENENNGQHSSSQTAKGNKMEDNKQDGNVIDNSKQDQAKIKDIQKALQTNIKQTPKKQPSDQATLADVEDNNYETIHDIVKYPRKNFRSSDYESIAEENHHMIEKSATQGFTKGFKSDTDGSMNSEKQNAEQKTIASQESNDNSQAKVVNTPERYNIEAAQRPISEFHKDMTLNQDASESGRYSELRKQSNKDIADGNEQEDTQKRDSKQTSKMTDNKESRTAQSVKLGPKGPSAWHKPPKVQISNHVEAESRHDEYPVKNTAQGKKPAYNNINVIKKPDGAQSNAIPQNFQPEGQPQEGQQQQQQQKGFQQVQMLQVPQGNGNGKDHQQQQQLDPDQVMLMNEADRAGQEMEHDMESNSMDNDMPDMGAQNGGMRHHISRKAEPPGATLPTSAVRDFIKAQKNVEDASLGHQLVARTKIQKKSKRTPVRLDGVQKSKTAEKNKGILVKDPFLESSHFWPLDQKKIIAVTDLQTGHNGILMNGSTIKKDNEINLPYATTEHPGSYIILGDFNGTCFSNPGKCILGGLTLSFWANLQRDHVHDVQDAYIISGGGQSKESRGFAFLFFHGTYVFIISTADKQWKLTIDEANVPTKKWANFAFVWNRNGELTYYLNGKKQNSTKSKATERPKDDYPLITVGKPNNADGKDYMYPLRIHSIAMWDRPLKPDQIKSIYDSLKAMEEESKLRKRFKVART